MPTSRDDIARLSTQPGTYHYVVPTKGQPAVLAECLVKGVPTPLSTAKYHHITAEAELGRAGSD